MSEKKPDLFWALLFIVTLGAASASLMGGEGEPRMGPEQAGIIGR